MSVQKNGQKIIQGTRKKKTGIWEVPPETKQSEAVTNNILAQTYKPKLAWYLNESLFSPITASLHNSIIQGFLNTLKDLIEKLIKRHLEKSTKTAIGHLHMRRQGLQ